MWLPEHIVYIMCNLCGHVVAVVLEMFNFGNSDMLSVAMNVVHSVY